MWWGGRGQSFNIAPQKEEPEMGLSGPKSNPGNRMPEPSSHQLGSCLASGCLPGEHILAWAPGRRKGPGLDLPGTLICTNFRVTFQPCGWQRKQKTEGWGRVEWRKCSQKIPRSLYANPRLQ